MLSNIFIDVPDLFTLSCFMDFLIGIVRILKNNLIALNYCVTSWVKNKLVIINTICIAFKCKKRTVAYNFHN